jgi:pimeloyl-ACP methyl ester carboxylesterase
MRYWVLIPFASLLLFVAQPAPAMARDDSPATSYAPQSAPLSCYPDGLQDSGAIYRICMPTFPRSWNRELVIWAHGYVAPERPIEIPEDQMELPGGPSIPDLVTSLGYGFATTSYSTNGLAVVQGLADVVDLVDVFVATEGTPERVYLVGASEGGLITALAVEQYPDVFDGGMAMCGPYGDFRKQIDHLGDFRVVFDYFFPGLMPGDPVAPPDWLWTSWDTYYAAQIEPAIQDPANAEALAQMLSVAKAAYDPQEPLTQGETVEYLLRYNAMATTDGREKLGGQPYENLAREYTGSADDEKLNDEIARFEAEAVALAALELGYQTTGSLEVPLVSLHTTGDPLVPYWHATIYQQKTEGAGNPELHEHFQTEVYGHCRFGSLDILMAFNRMVAMVDDPPEPQPRYLQFLPLVTIEMR